jgi:phospholipid-transporting ATPase
MGLFDKVCSAETMLKYPALYKPSQNADLFNVKVFWVWILNSLGHSVLLYWLPLFAAEEDVIWSNGREGGYLLLGNIVYSVSQLTVANAESGMYSRPLCFKRVSSKI